MMEAKVHILHVIESLNPFGGTPVKLYYQVLNSAAHLKFTMCCVVSAGGLADKFEELGIEVIALNYRRNYNLHQARNIIRIIRERNVDIVHTHFARSNTYGRIAAILQGKPMIVSEHGIPRNTSLPMYFFDSLLNLFTSHHISNSQATLCSARKTVLLNRKNMSVIHNGIPDTFKELLRISMEDLKQEFGFRPNDFIILDVGSHVFWRSHITLIEAVSKLRFVIPEMKVILIGDGPTHSSLRKAVEESRLEGQVFLLKRVERKKVHRFMCSADIYVNPAISEGFGIATVEAMLCELAIVCANSGSLPELINHNKEGKLFEPKNADELSQCILELYKSKEMGKFLGKNARKRALERFSIGQFVKAFEEKYLSTIEP